MAHTRWFHLLAANVQAASVDADPRHKSESGAGHNLSVTWNVAGTEALMKVNGANKPWRTGKGWIATAVFVYDRDNHSTAFLPAFYTSAWQAP